MLVSYQDAIPIPITACFYSYQWDLGCNCRFPELWCHLRYSGLFYSYTMLLATNSAIWGLCVCTYVGQRSILSVFP